VRKIFRLIYRVDGGLSRQTAGAGIGLALVRQLAEAMGGTVDIVNREPGAEFSACFPRLRRPSRPGLAADSSVSRTLSDRSTSDLPGGV